MMPIPALKRWAIVGGTRELSPDLRLRTSDLRSVLLDGFCESDFAFFQV